MARRNLNKGNPEIPFIRDEQNNILYGEKHRAYVRDILDPTIRFVEAEGAVRAGKDVYGLAAYAKFLDLHPNKYHLALATTVAMAQLLIIDADGFGIMHHFPDGYLGEVKDKTAFIFTDSKGRQKFLVVAGGQNENSYKGIRGLNYGSVYANEANLLHIKSLEEAKRRIMASAIPKFVSTQNPDAPNSQFYEEFEKPLMRPGEQKYYVENPNGVWNGPNFRYHHFLQYDNPALSKEQIAENLQTFASEVDKQRNFFGLRVAGEGAIFDMLTEENFYSDGDGTITAFQKYTWDRILGIDVGTTNPQIYIDCFVDPETFTLYWDREYRWDSKVEGRQKTDSEYADDLIDFLKAQADGTYNYIIVDPAAAGFIAELNDRGLIVIPADNTVMGKRGKGDTDDNKHSVKTGLKLVQLGFSRKRIKINKDQCTEGIKELRSYRWDIKARERGVEQPLKAGDHFPDAGRYIVNTHIKYAIRWGVSQIY